MATAAQTYAKYVEVREPYLKRARDASRLTIPSLVPPRWVGPHADLPTPYQGVGAMGVNNLSSKLLLSLLPPTQPFFRLVPLDPEALRQGGDKVQTEIEEGLARMEKVIASEIEVMALRVKVFEALKHLIIAGNVVLHLQPDGASRVVGLEQFVARRDPMGWLECLIVKESLDRDTLPPELEALVSRTAKAADPIPGPGIEAADPQRQGYYRRDAVALYTCVDWDADKEMYRLYQEVEGKRVPNVQGMYPPALLPFRVLRYAAIDGEDYGRGMVEEVIGDLVSLEGLMRSIVEAAAISSRCVGLVDPGGAATADDLNRAANGAYIVGRATDVTYPPVNKGGDLQVALAVIQRIEERLQRAFLLNTAVQRQAERVTAEEIRFVAQELESTLGGVFSVLSQELQLPLAQLVMDRLARQGRIPKLPKGTIRPAIVTGIEALGRGQELAKLQIAMQAAQAFVGPEAVGQYINVRTVLGQVFAAAGVDTTGILRTEEEVNAANQQVQLQEMIQRLGPSVIDQIGPGVGPALGLPGPPEGPQQQQPPPATPAR